MLIAEIKKAQLQTEKQDNLLNIHKNKLYLLFISILLVLL